MSARRNKFTQFRQPVGASRCCHNPCRKPQPVCVENCDPDTPLFVRLEEPVTVDGCLSIQNKESQAFLTASKVFNTEDCPVYICNTTECPLFADITGDVSISSFPEDPLCIKMQWGDDAENAVPVFGKMEICNCNGTALLFESDQFKTSEFTFNIGGAPYPVGTSIANLIGALAQSLTIPPPDPP